MWVSPATYSLLSKSALLNPDFNVFQVPSFQQRQPFTDHMETSRSRFPEDAAWENDGSGSLDAGPCVDEEFQALQSA